MTRSDVLAVLLSDVHFNISTLELAAKSLRCALIKSQELGVPLIIAGDLNDTKAVMRAECVNSILSILKEKKEADRVVVLVGNHDRLNEKSKEHSLHFLDNIAEVIDSPTFDPKLNLWLVPYFSDMEALAEFLKIPHPGDTLIMHQGIKGAFMGEYVVDKSSIDTELVADFRVISGHYHRTQDIVCGRPRKNAVGLWTYIGTPYSITAAEAQDGPKGIQLLKSNGLLEKIPLNLRKHVTVERDHTEVLESVPDLRSEDLFWLKVHGPASELDKLNKKQIGMALIGHENFKLDLIPSETAQRERIDTNKLPDDQILDQLIQESSEPEEQKQYLQTLWREILK